MSPIAMQLCRQLCLRCDIHAVTGRLEAVLGLLGLVLHCWSGTGEQMCAYWCRSWQNMHMRMMPAAAV